MQKQRYRPGNQLHRIVCGEVPSFRLFETESSMAILWGTPETAGHSVLISKGKFATPLETSPAEYGQFMSEVPVLAAALTEATGAGGMTIVQQCGTAAGQFVPHMHVELIPRFETGGGEKKEAPITMAQRDAVGGGRIMSPEDALPLMAAIKQKLPPTHCGWSFHAATEEDTSRIGSALSSVVQPGDVILLSGELGSGKTCIARALIRSFFHNPVLDVPSPSFVLNYTYSADEASYHKKSEDENGQNESVGNKRAADEDGDGNNKARRLEGGEAAEGSASAAAAATSDVSMQEGEVKNDDDTLRIPCIHHIDPYRLRNNAEGKMTALFDFKTAFSRDVTIIEWPERLGASVITANTPERLEIRFDGVGPQGQGRWLSMRGVGERWMKRVQEWSAKGEITTPDGVIAFNAQSKNGAHLQGEDGAGIEKKVQLQGEQSDWVVLGIDTSCDDTGAAIVRGDGTILAEMIASQTGLHEEFGGVKPDVAQKAHKDAIHKTVDGVIEKAGIPIEKLTAIAVTVGPGLSLCLEVGVRKAMEIAATYRLPLVRVHHMEAHAMITRLPKPADVVAAAATGGEVSIPRKVVPAYEFPILTLLVSGGHNMLVLSRGIGQHIILGSTLDDSVGEAFDKVARVLGIDAIPGGPALEKLAAKGDPSVYKSKITPPLSQSRSNELRLGCDFSFAGLKTNVQSLMATETAKITKSFTDETEREAQLAIARQNIAATFQLLAVNHLSERTSRAIARVREHEQINCLVAAGGVAANSAVRSSLTEIAKANNLPFVCPPLRLCTDNGVMIAWTGIERMSLGLLEGPPPANSFSRYVEVLPRWPIGPRDPRSIVKPGMVN